MSPPTASANRTVVRTYKYRIYPTRSQIIALEEQLAFCCDLYNTALEQRRDAWKRGRSITCYEQQRDLTDIRASLSYPEGMSRKVQCDALVRLDRAFEAFFRRCKTGEKPGYPRFRSKARYDSLTWLSKNGASFEGGHVRLMGIGRVRVRYHRDIPEDAGVRTITAQMRRSARGTLEEPGRNVRAKAGLNRRMAEQPWGQFIELLWYKAEEAGTQVVKVNPRFTSQTCAECGHVASESRKAEKFVCVACGHRDDADINAARNILARGLGRSLQAPTVGVEVRTVA